MRPGKLVRDFIPDKLRESGLDPHIEVLSDADRFRHALIDKMHEEVEELRAAISMDSSIEELADLLEVLRALIDEYGVEFNTVEEIAHRKTQDVGSFAKRIYLVENVAATTKR